MRDLKASTLGNTTKKCFFILSYKREPKISLLSGVEFPAVNIVGKLKKILHFS